MPQSFKPFPPRRKMPSSRPLADLVGPCIGPALGKHGFGEADVLMHWPEIVGSELAGRCQPLRLQWRPRATADTEARAEPATLVVRVEGASAIALQHMGSVIVERVNAYLGWRCIGRLALRQGPLPRLSSPRKSAVPADPTTVAAAEDMVADVEDAGLREALAKLGARALRKPEPSREGRTRMKFNEPGRPFR